MTQALIEEYLSALNSNNKDYIHKVRKELEECSEIFRGLGITYPTAPDFETLKEVLSHKPGKRGKVRSKDTQQDMISHARKYYDYIKKAGKADMTTAPETTEQQTAAPTAPMTEQPQQTAPRRGRKLKPEAEKRSVKMSIYLTPEIYEGMKACAAISRQDLSDLFNQIAADCVERNAEAIKEYRRFLDRIGGIK